MRQIATLSDVCEINPKHSLKGLPEEMDVSFIAMADVSEVTKSIKNSFQKKLGNVRKGFTHFSAEDVLVAKITPCYENGKMAIVEIPNELGFGSTEFHVFRPYKEKIIPKFLFYFLDSPLIRRLGAKNMTGSAGQKRVPIKFFQNLHVPLPSIEEQKRIVRKLDEAGALRQKRKEAIALLDDYIDSIFFSMFVNNADKGIIPLIKLEEIATKITDGVHAKPKYVESGVPFISVTNITTKKLTFNNCKFISDIEHQSYIKRCKPECNDILYTKVGATYGRACVVDTEDEFSLYVSVALIKPKKDLVTSTYLKYALNSKFVKHQADRSVKGAGVPDLHLIEIKSFDIPLPSISEQKEFSNIVKRIEQLKQCMIVQSEDLDKNFNLLIQKAFDEKSI